MKISKQKNDVIVTHALGSCLGIVAFDPAAGVGGMFHAMLPNASVNPDKAKSNPYMFVDVGTPLFFKELYKHGADKKNLIVKVCGGASIGAADKDDYFAIGKRNFVMLRKLFWTNGIIIKNQDVGGSISRTLYLDLKDGRTWILSGGKEWEL